jgi:hypothetical protein
MDKKQNKDVGGKNRFRITGFTGLSRRRRFEMKSFLIMALMATAFCTAASNTVSAAQQKSKEEIYTTVFENIEKAKTETVYEKKQELYSTNLLLIGINVNKKVLSETDAELVKVNDLMTALEKELWNMYNDRKKSGGMPQYEPAEYKNFAQIVAESEASKKAKEKAAKNPPKPAAQESYISLRNDRNQEIGRMLADGTVRNARNQKIGAIGADGTVKNDRNQKIGAIEANGTVKNGRNQKIGAIESNGTVKNERNQKIGAIEADGTVKNEKNQKIGAAAGVKKEWAAAFFFFFFNR